MGNVGKICLDAWPPWYIKSGRYGNDEVSHRKTKEVSDQYFFLWNFIVKIFNYLFINDVFY